jgi:hypothetical protein
VEELVIADLTLFDRIDTPTILHHHSKLCRLGSWCSTDIEDHLSWLWIEDESGELRRYRLEIDESSVECLGSFDRVLMLTIEHIGSIDTNK